MSWWDRFFAPGDVRARQQRAAIDEANAEAERIKAAAALASQRARNRVDPATRVRRQNGLLYGGVAFTALSLFVTRRTLLRKRVQTQANALAQANGAPQPMVDGGLEALHALNIATLNVFSFTMLSVGAAMKWLDIAEVEDLRALLRQSIGEDMYAGDSRADHEIEGWIANVLSRKDGQGQEIREGVAEKLAEIERQRKEGRPGERR